jgi:hypothetical protein
MKKEIIYIIIFAAILPFAACKEDVPTIFAEPDGIYFSAAADSMTYTFAKYPTRVSDTLRIPVTVLGNAAGTDRTITLEKLSGTDINGTRVFITNYYSPIHYLQVKFQLHYLL